MDLSQSRPDDYLYYDNLLAAIAANDPAVKVVRNNSVLQVEYDGKMERILNVAACLRLDTWRKPMFHLGFKVAGAVLMAVHDFNTRNDRIIRNLGELTEGCNSKIYLELFDRTRPTKNVVLTGGAAILTKEIYKKEYPYEMAAVIGNVGSHAAKPMALLNAANQIPQVDFVSESSLLNSRKIYKYFGRTTAEDIAASRALVEYLKQETKSTHICIVYVRDQFGTDFRIQMEQAALDAGIVVRSLPLTWHGANITESVIQVVEDIIDLGYNHFVGFFFREHLAELIELGAPRGLFGKDKFWVITRSLGNVAFLRRNLQYRLDTPQADALQGIAVLQRSVPQGSRYELFQRYYEELNDNPEFLEYFANKTGPGSVYDGYRFNFTPQGLYNFLAYDTLMAVGIASCQTENPLYTGPDLFEAFMETSFIGASGLISLDPENGSRAYNRSTFEILNAVQGTTNDEGLTGTLLIQAAQFGVVDTDQPSFDNKWVFTGAGFSYADRTLNPPPSLPPMDIEEDCFKPVSYGLVASVSILLMLSAVAFACWTLRFRRSRVVLASQPEFLIAICLGAFFMAFSCVTLGVHSPPLSAEWANFSCMANEWFFLTGFGLAFAALFAKTWRINKILGAEVGRFERVVVGLKDVVLPGLLIVVGNLVLLLIWQIVDPRKYVKVSVDESFDEFGRPLTRECRCESEKGLDAYFVAASFILNGVAIAAANVQAYRARKIQIEYSESKYIGLSMGIILQVVVVALPVILFPSNPNANFLASAVIRFVTTSAVLFPIFLPKIGFFLHDRKMTELRLQERASRSLRLKLFIGQIEQIREGSKEEPEHEIVFGLSSDSGLQILGHARRSSLKRSLSDLGSGMIVRNQDSSNDSISLRQDSPEISDSDDMDISCDEQSSTVDITNPKGSETAGSTISTTKEDCNATTRNDGNVLMQSEEFQESEIIMVDDEVSNDERQEPE